MATGRISDHRAETWLNQLQSGFYLALHHDNPDVAGAMASEVNGGGYSRKLCPFDDATNRAIWNRLPVKWTGLPAVIVTHVALWDSLANGNYEGCIALPVPFRAGAGQTLEYSANMIAFSLD